MQTKPMIIAGILSLAFSLAGGVFANETDDARVFFNQLVQNTQNPLIATLAKESLQKLHKQENAQRVEIPLLSQMSGSLAVPVMIGQSTMATFIVDTGATYTVITPRLAAKLGITVTPDMPRMTILTANGPIRAPKVIIPELSVGGMKVSNVEAIVQDLGSDTMLAGLLGVNFFKDVELTVKTDRLILSVNAG